MSSEPWTEVKLDEVVEITSSKRIFLSDYVSEGVPFFRSKEIIERFHGKAISTELFISEEKFEEIKSKFGVPIKDDILLTSVGTIGIPMLVKGDDRFYFKDGNLTWIRKYKNGIAAKYLFYWLISPNGKEKIQNNLIGSTQQALTIQALKSILIPLPPLPSQRRIATILTALDDKIELNRRMNETLEGIAQAVWGEWFGKYAGGEVGKLSALGEFITVKHGFAFKGEHISDVEGANILVTPGNFSIGGGFNEKKLRYFEGDEFPQEYILNPKDLVLTMTDLSREGDTLGYPAFVPEIHGKKLLHNQRIGLVEFRNARLGKYFLYGLMKTDEYRSFILGGATGSTVRHTSPGRICDFKFPERDKEKITEFELVADGLHNLVELNLQQSRTLTALRDVLLPRLMRGEVLS